MNITDNSEYFNQLVFSGAMQRYGNIGKNIEKRLNFELQVINDKKWAQHFLLMRDMLDAIRAKGALVCPGGGYASASLVAYCLRITDIDPIAYSLLFERFINTESTIIHFSVSADTEGKNDAIRFLVEKGIIHKRGWRNNNPDGSEHSTGEIIVEKEFEIWFPDNKSLSAIRKVAEYHQNNDNMDIDFERIPTDDPVVYQKFANGEASGLLEVENAEMKELCLRLFKPSNIEDLAALYSLNAYGICRIEMIAKLIDRKKGYEKFEYVIPEMEKHLKNTYGLAIYQEQVMNISSDLAGFSPCQSNEFRRILGKKLVGKLNEFRVMFLDGCTANGYDKSKAAEIWNQLVNDDYLHRNKYLYNNKSHAISVALNAYRIAWFKTYYPNTLALAMM